MQAMIDVARLRGNTQDTRNAEVLEFGMVICVSKQTTALSYAARERSATSRECYAVVCHNDKIYNTGLVATPNAPSID